MTGLGNKVETALTKHPAENLSKLILEKRTDRLKSKAKNWLRKNPIASDIGECSRQIVYGVLDWDKKALFAPELIARFEVGNQRESEIVRELGELGFQVVDGQQQFEVKDKTGGVLVSGRIDGKINFEGRRVPFEIKSMNPLIWNKIESIEDFEKKSYLRRYIRQMQIYLYANNEEMGLFLLDDCLGHLKILLVSLDYESTELILRRLEAIKLAIKSKVLPDRIAYSSETCGKCPFNHICLPIETLQSNSESIDSAELESKLDRWSELAPVAKEFESLDREVKETLRAIPIATVGNPVRYVATTTERERESYDFKLLPKEVLEPVKKITKFLVTKIEKVLNDDATRKTD